MRVSASRPLSTTVTSCSRSSTRRRVVPTSGSSSTTRMRPSRRTPSLALAVTTLGTTSTTTPGSATTKVDPRPGSLSKVIVPPRAVTMPWQMESPSPVPRPTGRVV